MAQRLLSPCLLVCLALSLGASAVPGGPLAPRLATKTAPGEPRASALQPATAGAPRTAIELADVPLHFEPNLGQADPQVKFLARGLESALFLTGTEALLTLSLQQTSRPSPAAGTLAFVEEGEAPATVRWSLVGANPSVEPRGLDELPGKINYFLGNDPSAWQTNIPTYGRVSSPNVYPGIDLLYYGSQNRVEYDFVVGPGADPSTIALRFDALAGTFPPSLAELNEAGDLVLHGHARDITLRRPTIYQTIDGVRQEVEGGYAMRESAAGSALVGFRVGAYDPAFPLVIDPVVDLSRYLGFGGSSLNGGNGIALAPDGSAIYVTGNVRGDLTAQFPGSPAAAAKPVPAPDPNANPPVTACTALGGCAFVVKFDAKTNELQASAYFGGNGTNRATGIATEPAGVALTDFVTGTVYVVGDTTAADFPMAGGSFNKTLTAKLSGSNTEVFVAALKPDLSGLVYGTYLGGERDNHAAAVAAPGGGDIYLTGTTYSASFPVTSTDPSRPYLLKAFQSSLAGADPDGTARNAFVVHLNVAEPTKWAPDACTLPSNAKLQQFKYTNCHALVFASFLGGAGADPKDPLGGPTPNDGFAIAVGGGTFVAGQTCSKSFPKADMPLNPVVAPYQNAANDGCDGFVVKILESSNSASLDTRTYLGGGAWDLIRGLAASGGWVAVTGETASGSFPTTANALKTKHSGGTYDAFLSVLDPDLHMLGYSTFFGGNGDNYGYAVTNDPAGPFVYVAGRTCSDVDFPHKGALPDPLFSAQSPCHAFVTKLMPPAGPSSLVYSTYLGGTSYPGGTIGDVGKAIVTDGQGGVWVTGQTFASDFPAKPAIDNKQLQGAGFAFVTKLLPSPCTGAGPLAYVSDGSIIDTANDCLLADKIAWASPLEGRSMAVSPDGSRLYGQIAVGKDWHVLVADPSTKQTVKTVDVPPANPDGNGPRGVAMSPDGNRLYVANHSHITGNYGSVDVIDTVTNTLTKSIPVHAIMTYNPDAVAVTPDGARVYVGMSETNPSAVEVVKTQDNSLMPTIPSPIKLGTAAFHGQAMAATPDGKWVYTANYSSNNVSVIDTSNNSVTSIDQNVGGNPQAIAITPDGKFAYVTGTAAGISVIDTGAQKVVKTIQGGGPVFFVTAGLAVTPDSKKVYVATEKGVAVIDVATNTFINFIPGPTGTAIVVAPPDLNGDGIIDDINGKCVGNVFTPAIDNFAEPGCGVGASSGSIGSRNGLKVTAWEAFPKGFYLRGVGNDPAKTATINLNCQNAPPSFDLPPDGLAYLKCGSLVLTSIRGTMSVPLGNGSRLLVPAGGAVTVSQPPGGPTTIESQGTTALTIVNAQGQEIASIAAGQTLTNITTPPVTSASFSGRPGASGWYTVSPSITLASTGATWGVANIYYQLVTHGTPAPANLLPGAWSAYAVPFAAPGGDHDLYAFAVDTAGNAETPVNLGDFKVDGLAPATTATTTGPQGNAGWYTGNVSVTLTATDNTGGSGVQSLTYSATGAQPLASATVAGATATVALTAGGTTTLTFAATDVAGNAETAQTLVIKVDKTLPSVQCAAPDAQWHATDVSIACTAADVTSGLASAADASFSLTTNVSSGAETANASTGSRSVCDVAGNCATAGPIGGIKVDKKAPVITIGAPTSAVYLLNQVVKSSYACADGGSGVATCAGPVASGANLDTGTVGTKTFTVTARDAAGNVGSQSVSYTVAFNTCAVRDGEDDQGIVAGPAGGTHEVGSTVVLSVQLCDAQGRNVSSRGIVVTATTLTPGTLPPNDFDQGRLGTQFAFRGDDERGYAYKIKTKGFAPGTYTLSFTAAGDPTVHTVSLTLRASQHDDKEAGQKGDRDR